MVRIELLQMAWDVKWNRSIQTDSVLRPVRGYNPRHALGVHGTQEAAQVMVLSSATTT